ncbi:alpha/beta fold hydrolase [Actinomadura kijaniata]|uniref:alpha/beta fold hydrolase n=1 Tax=Actinomadura kijaniata TaxID=46161 RepID=UPI003F19F3C9
METVTSTDGTVIAYERTGSGPAVVLVSGALCDRHAHDPLAALLSEHFTVYNYDRRGRGDSGDNGSLDDPMDQATRQEFDDLAAVVRAAGGRACLFGASSGAILAWRAAAHGVPAAGVALWEPPYGRTEEESRAHLDYYADIRGLIAEGRRDDALARFIRMTGAPEEAMPRIRQEPWWPRMAEIAPTLRYDACAMGDGLLHPEEFADLTVPVLLMEGEETMEVLHRAADRVREAVPGVRHTLIKGQNHEFEADALAPTLVEFFRAAS